MKVLLLLIAFIFPALTSSAPAQAETSPEKSKYLDVNMESLSKTYWRIGKMDIENDNHIDNFILINQCDVFREYYHNEFQWDKIRQSARQMLDANKRSFPIRLQTVQPLRFGEYNFEKEGFELWADYDIDGMRRQEIMANEFEDEICGYAYNRKIAGYPRGIVAEFSQPITLDIVPVRPEKAERYIQEKAENFKTRDYYQQTEKALYKSRDAYLVLKFKAFAYKGDGESRDGQKLASILSVIEALEVYSDKELTDLLYEREFRKKRTVSSKERELRKKYQERKKLHFENLKKAQETKEVI